MPVLFLILAEKLGLAMAMAEAPNHVFLRYRHASGSIINLEPTSGALPARDEWIKRVRPMSDRAIRSGLYMRTLSRREGVALMAATVLQHRMDTRRYEEAITIAEAILAHKPRCGITLANKGLAFFHILQTQFLEKYRTSLLIPPPLRPRYLALLEKNHAAFAAARALGWEPVE